MSSARKIIFIVALVSFQSALAASPEVLEMAQDTKDKMKFTNVFEERLAFVNQLRKALSQKAKNLYPEKERLQDQVEDYEAKMDAEPVGSSNYDRYRTAYDLALLELKKVATPYYDSMEMISFLNLIPPFDNKTGARAQNCQDATKHLRGTTTLPTESKVDLQGNLIDILGPLRTQALQVGLVLYGCPEH